MKERHYCVACEQRANADGECQCKEGYAAIKTNEKNVFDDITKERERQFEKWGEQNYEPYKWLAILGEEFGEACKGALENNFDNYREELVQVAAVAVAAIKAYDRKMEVKDEQNIQSYNYWLIKLGKEYGEACKGALENNFDNYKEELTKIITMANAAHRHRDYHKEVKNG